MPHPRSKAAARFVERKRRGDSEMDMLRELVAREVAKTRPLAIASGGPREIVERSLAVSGLAALFPVVVSADDVVHGKPSPDMFLLAAKRMGVPADRCLVFEDAEPGMRAAEAAGMPWVRVDSRKIKG